MKTTSFSLGKMRIASLLLIAAVLVPCLAADDISWDGGGDGTTFSEGLNWVGDVAPGTGDKAVFPLNANTTVSLDADTTVMSVITGVPTNNPVLTFDLGGHTLTLTSTEEHSPPGNFGIDALWMGSYHGQQFEFQFQNGTVDVETAFTLGGNGGANRPPSVLRIQEDALLHSGTDSALISLVGRNGLSEMHIEDGGEWISDAEVRVANNFTDAAGSFIRVTDSGSKWTANALAQIGSNRTGHLQVLAGGEVEATVMTFAALGASGSNGTTGLVSGTGSLFSADEVYLGGSSSNSSGTATFTVANGGSAEIQELKVWETGTVFLDDGVLTTGGVGAGASVLDPDSILRFGLYSSAQPASLVALSDLAINGVNLEVELDASFDPAEWDMIPLIRYDAALTGFFAGLPEGGGFGVGDYWFIISYAETFESFPDSQFVMLTVIPEPGSALLGLLGVFLLVMRRVRR